MDIELLLRRMEDEQSITVSRAASATLARLATEAVRTGRRAAIAVKSRESLFAMRALTTLFTPELSVGRPSESAPVAGKKALPVEVPLWEKPWVFLPPFTPRSLSREGWAERFAVLYALHMGAAKGIVFTADNLIPLLPPRDFLDGRVLTVRRGEDFSPELLTEQLVEWGYQRVPMVAHAGDMARRGDIFDVLPPGYERPLRIEFFGDTIDEMRVFDFTTQRSVGQLEEVTLLPVTPLGFGDAWAKGIRKHWKALEQRKAITALSHTSLQHALDQADMRLAPGVVYADATHTA